MNLNTARHLMPISNRSDYEQAHLGWFPERLYEFRRPHRMRRLRLILRKLTARD